MVMIEIGSPKMAREMLCRLQFANAEMYDWEHARIQSMIDQLDMHRPLGTDGKHGDRHTETCGCEDKSRSRYIVRQSITGHETKQIETNVWNDDAVTYRHRIKKRDIWDSGGYWSDWKDGRGE